MQFLSSVQGENVKEIEIEKTLRSRCRNFSDSELSEKLRNLLIKHNFKNPTDFIGWTRKAILSLEGFTRKSYGELWLVLFNSGLSVSYDDDHIIHDSNEYLSAKESRQKELRLKKETILNSLNASSADKRFREILDMFLSGQKKRWVYNAYVVNTQTSEIAFYLSPKGCSRQIDSLSHMYIIKKNWPNLLINPECEDYSSLLLKDNNSSNILVGGLIKFERVRKKNLAITLYGTTDLDFIPVNHSLAIEVVNELISKLEIEGKVTCEIDMSFKQYKFSEYDKKKRIFI
jgi:hypothetical protein